LAERKAAEAEMVVKQERFSSLATNADMKTYLSLEPRIRTKSLVMSPAQEANWKALLGRLGPALRDMQKIQADIKAVGEQIAVCAARIEKLKAEREAANAAVGCQIDQVSGDTSVRGRRLSADSPALDSLPPKDLRARLHESLESDLRIFFDHAGSVRWPVNAAAP
jgi:2-keto-3-deoxy-galactonokinase